MKQFLCFLAIVFTGTIMAQDSTTTYTKRVLETTEIDILSSYYSQEGDNAAVTGGIGTEELTDTAGSIIVSIPLNDDDVLTIDAGVSAYTSASSSNVNAFDGSGEADPFVASSGASGKDVWGNFTAAYSHSSEDRNDIWSANASFSVEYDYSSFGFGGSYTKLFNEKNTELSASGNVFIDNWKIIYPEEIRFDLNNDFLPGLEESGRNSYSLGLGFSQILSKNAQFSLSFDAILQDGLLSTPFQRVYFGDRVDIIAENFQLADDIERLPNSRFKTAIGGRFNYYINEIFVLRTYYRYYSDDWGIGSHTASVEVPIKIAGGMFTLYPSYRYYNQTAADYFKAANEALSTDEFYTSDYDLSEYSANQFSLGLTYTDIFAKLHIASFGLKNIDLKVSQYDRDTTFSSFLVSAGFKFVND